MGCVLLEVVWLQLCLIHVQRWEHTRTHAYTYTKERYLPTQSPLHIISMEGELCIAEKSHRYRRPVPVNSGHAPNHPAGTLPPYNKTHFSVCCVHAFVTIPKPCSHRFRKSLDKDIHCSPATSASPTEDCWHWGTVIWVLVLTPEHLSEGAQCGSGLLLHLKRGLATRCKLQSQFYSKIIWHIPLALPLTSTGSCF